MTDRDSPRTGSGGVGYTIWIWSRLRRQWGRPLYCQTLTEALNLSEKLNAR